MKPTLILLFISSFFSSSCQGQSNDESLIQNFVADLQSAQTDSTAIVKKYVAFSSADTERVYLIPVIQQVGILKNNFASRCPSPKIIKHGDNLPENVRTYNLQVKANQTVYYILCGNDIIPVLTKNGKIASLTVVVKGNRPKYFVEY